MERHDNSDRFAASARPRFEVHAEYNSSLLAKVIGTFAAQRIDLIRVLARRSCGGMWIDLEADMEFIRAEQIGQRLATLFGVAGVLVVPPPSE